MLDACVLRSKVICTVIENKGVKMSDKSIFTQKMKVEFSKGKTNLWKRGEEEQEKQPLLIPQGWILIGNDIFLYCQSFATSLKTLMSSCYLPTTFQIGKGNGMHFLCNLPFQSLTSYFFPSYFFLFFAKMFNPHHCQGSMFLSGVLLSATIPKWFFHTVTRACNTPYHRQKVPFQCRDKTTKFVVHFSKSSTKSTFPLLLHLENIQPIASPDGTR